MSRLAQEVERMVREMREKARREPAPAGKAAPAKKPKKEARRK